MNDTTRSHLSRNLTFMAMGIVFGYLLSQAGATDPAMISSLLLFQDLHLLWVIVTAVGVGALLNGAAKLMRLRALGQKEPMKFKHKPFVPLLVPGALLFGAGWALTGVCPGTAPAMLGEGRWFAGIILVGIVIGTWLTGWIHALMNRRAHTEEHHSAPS